MTARIAKTDIELELILLYDETVTRLSADDPSVPLADIREAMLAPTVELLLQSERDVEREAKALFNRVVMDERERRSRNLKRDLDYIIDAALNPESAANVDALLPLAYRTGDASGTDRLLANWRIDDLQAMTFARYRQAAAAMAEARAIDESAQTLILAMASHGAVTISDLFAGSAAA